MKISIIGPAIKRLYTLLTPRHRTILWLLVIMTIGFSLIETLGISAIMPFISIASNQELLDGGIYKKVFDITGFQQKNDFVLFFGIAIIAFYVFRAIYSIAHTYLINRYSMAINKFFANKLFKIILSIPYKAYVQKNSSDFISVINNESRELSNLALNVLQLCTELFTIILIYILLLVVNWMMTLVLTGILVVLVSVMLLTLIRKNKKLGAVSVEAGRRLVRTLTESFGNYKFIKLKGNKKSSLEDYAKAISDMSKTRITANTLSILPKSILESLGFSLLIAVVIYIIAAHNDPSMVIPVISMYALALYRILPSIHRMICNLNNIAYVQQALDHVDEALQFPVENDGNGTLAFNKSVELNDVSFKYATGSEVLNNISLSITKGEKVAIIGESGGGKSTLIDVLIGIHKPLSGEIHIDGQQLTEANIGSWRKRIGYIPQSIYLFDGTVAENVAFGSDFNEEKINLALQKANIKEFLDTKDGIHTIVGEKGIQLSGGQLQRIGIARAMYDDPEVLVLDEATSSLDTETESKIMDEIYAASENKTLIIIAHRLSTVERCNRKIQLDGGKIAQEQH